jgi:hypothetical protein
MVERKNWSWREATLCAVGLVKLRSTELLFAVTSVLHAYSVLRKWNCGNRDCGNRDCGNRDCVLSEDPKLTRLPTKQDSYQTG